MPPFPFDAASERNAGEIALKIVRPLMIGADEFFDVATELATEFRGAMRTAVLDDIDRAVVRAHDDHRRRPDIGADEVAGLGHFAFQSDVVPGAAVKNLLDLALIDRLIGVDPIRDAGETFCRPDVTLRQPFFRLHGAGNLASIRFILLCSRANAIPRVGNQRRIRGRPLHVDADVVPFELNGVGAEILRHRRTQRLA